MKSKALIGLAASVLLAEASVRLLGLGDFPLYDANNEIGYIPKASQQGAFMNKNDWVFNSVHMGASEFKPGPGRDILLVGDSVVYGGNTYRQSEKLGPNLARLMPTGTQVWPIGAGSWSINNELTWLKQHADVVRQVEDVIFVLNSGDLEDHSSSWRCESTHPTHKPPSVLWYQIKKHYKLESCPDVPDGMAVGDRSWREALRGWMASPEAQGKRLLFVLYPGKDEWLRGARPVLPLLAQQLRELGIERIVDAGSDPTWHVGLFQDGIHPTPAGNTVLAGIIARQLTAGQP